MSDYLWDKTGEPEEDVEHLENLLGQLRFQPRTFEVPTLIPVAPRRATPARNSFTWSRLAVAASLLLVLLAGAWLIKMKQRTNDATQLAVTKPPSVTTQQPAQQPTQKELAATSTNDNSTHAPKSVEKHQAFETVEARNLNRRSRGEEISLGLKRRESLPRHSNVGDVNAPREEIAKLTPQEKLAMGQFMLAMKVTSEKLNYAERQVATLNAPQR